MDITPKGVEGGPTFVILGIKLWIKQQTLQDGGGCHCLTSSMNGLLFKMNSEKCVLLCKLVI